MLLAEAEPSLTATVILALPVWPETGVMVTVREVPVPPKTIAEGLTSERLSEVPDRIRLAAGASISLMVKGSGGVLRSTAMITLANEEIVGIWFTGATVTMNERETRLLVAAPSLTMTVMIAEPKAKPTGRKVSAPVTLGLE